MRNNLALKIVTIILILTLADWVISDSLPEGPTTLDVINSTVRNVTAAKTLDTQAGNVTQVSISALSTTQTWAGYYGNVTGTIRLGDSSGFVLYDWDTALPQGQIYASTIQPSFAENNINCYNFTREGSGYLNLTSYESSLGLTNISTDGINETFNVTKGYSSFYVGANSINTSCPTVYLYNSSNSSTKDTHQEVILYDLTANDVIYTSILRRGGILGFNNEVWDFQMIVAENGHAGNTEPTTYYFYVSLQ